VRHGTEFIYLGRTTLRVTGPVTGTVYHFATPGARLRIDVCDAVALQRVPVLRAVGWTGRGARSADAPGKCYGVPDLEHHPL